VTVTVQLDSDYLRIIDPSAPARLGRIRHVLFDFDGTISVLREGWERVMAPLMVEMICDGNPPTPDIEREVAEYVDYSTGIVTIEQMGWLAEAVRRHGIARRPLTAAGYKQIYVDRLMVGVQRRLDRLNPDLTGLAHPGSGGRAGADLSDLQSQMMVAGARPFLKALVARGLRLYVASGTDHPYMLNEARALGVADFFEGGLYGAIDEDEAHRKERIIERILDEHDLHGDELLVVGDGPVEISEAVSRQALALGVGSDEVVRSGWNPAKVTRLTRAGAHFLVPDFSHAGQLAAWLTTVVKI
jgi:phosphoglycolate phosphatase-like HAD superfamily hydrolase